VFTWNSTLPREIRNHVISTIEYFAILSKSFPQSFRISSRILRKVRNDDIKLLCLRIATAKTFSIYSSHLNKLFLPKEDAREDRRWSITSIVDRSSSLIPTIRNRRSVCKRTKNPEGWRVGLEELVGPTGPIGGEETRGSDHRGESSLPS